MQTRWQSGFHRMDSRARFITSTRRSAALIRCRSRISPAARAFPFGGTYLELKPDEVLRYTDKFDDANLPGEMITTIALKKVSCGTELNVTQEGIPAVVPAEACYMGWQESLILLAKLVEAEIPDQP
jgi:uncharacterized protein YndB with AHSA1/START domain